MIKRILIILVITNFSSGLEAQSYQEKKAKDSLTIELVKKAFHSSELKSLNDLEELVHSINRSEKQISIVRRNIEYGAEHQIWWADILETKHEEHFSIIIQNSEIIGVELGSSGIDKKMASYISEERLQELKSSKEEEFGAISLSEDLLFPLEMKLFGHWCSIGGEPPEYCYRMLDLVNDRNKDQLRNWLLSFDPEIQAYGAEGLFYLQKEGISMNEEELKLIEKLKKINNTLIKCEGCFFYVRRNFKEDFSKKYLKRRYKSYKKSGWIYEK
ncbi:MAG: hypothetical protein R2828_32855 [Saprospiraceae bacterium]